MVASGEKIHRGGYTGGAVVFFDRVGDLWGAEDEIGGGGARRGKLAEEGRDGCGEGLELAGGVLNVRAVIIVGGGGGEVVAVPALGGRWKEKGPQRG